MSDHDQYDWRNYDLSDYPEEFVEDFKEILEQAKAHAARDPADVAADAQLKARRQFAPIWKEASEPLSRCFKEGGDYASLAELHHSAATMFESDTVGRNTLKSAFDMFEQIAAGDEDRSHDLRYAVTCLLLVALGSQTTNVYRQAAAEKETLKGLTAKTAAANQLVDRAQAIASELWAKDASRSLRVGDMAEHVFGRLLDEGVDLNQLPDRARVRKWIKPVAPDYAMRPGRAPRKS